MLASANIHIFVVQVWICVCLSICTQSTLRNQESLFSELPAPGPVFIQHINLTRVHDELA